MLYQGSSVAFGCIAISGILLLYYAITNYIDGIGNRQHCDSGFRCTDFYFNDRPDQLDTNFLATIKDRYFKPPPKEPPRRERFDIYQPVWRKLVDWYKVQEQLIDIYKNQTPGIFVEVGAVDGDFMSQTLYLERNLNWTGLLIEPDPRSFKALAKSGRNAWLSNICIREQFFSKSRFWLHDLYDDLPYHLIQLLMARSKLASEILIGDEEKGHTIWVPCLSLSMVLHAVGFKTVNLLTIATGEDEDYDKIKIAVHRKDIDIQNLLIHYPTELLFKKPYPRIRGYVLDINRSQLMVKLYHKLSHCTFLYDNKCNIFHFFSILETCYTYLCFGNLNVTGPNPHLELPVNW